MPNEIKPPSCPVCSVCGAVPGEWCRVGVTPVQGMLHAARFMGDQALRSLEERIYCSTDGPCWALRDHLSDLDKKTRGLAMLQTTYLTAMIETTYLGAGISSGAGFSRAQWMVLHRRSRTDRGLVLDFCPWCGGPTYFKWDREGNLVQVGTEIWQAVNPGKQPMRRPRGPEDH